MQATIVMKNGDRFEVEDAQSLYETLICRVETIEQVPKGMPLHKKFNEQWELTIRLDDCILSFNYDAVSHIVWVK